MCLYVCGTIMKQYVIHNKIPAINNSDTGELLAILHTTNLWYYYIQEKDIFGAPSTLSCSSNAAQRKCMYVV